jgi:hypothetical protein
MILSIQAFIERKKCLNKLCSNQNGNIERDMFKQRQLL